MGLDGGIPDDAAALAQMQRALPGREDAPRGIRVNAVGPGPIGTPFASKLGLPEEALRQSGEALAATVPFKRIGNAMEVAKAALFLAGDDTSYATGAELAVDGGRSPIRRHDEAHGRRVARCRRRVGVEATTVASQTSSPGWLRYLR
ncbi:SDR family oxidoreductase [Paraburkholderia strydomiana]|uniref:SDR family oxidoreductase n=2 Tax=Paraburkholderia strydomiana TaxID=1245417 RepID=UPI0038BBBFDE